MTPILFQLAPANRPKTDSARWHPGLGNFMLQTVCCLFARSLESTTIVYQCAGSRNRPGRKQVALGNHSTRNAHMLRAMRLEVSRATISRIAARYPSSLPRGSAEHFRSLTSVPRLALFLHVLTVLCILPWLHFSPCYCVCNQKRKIQQRRRRKSSSPLRALKPSSGFSFALSAPPSAGRLACGVHPSAAWQDRRMKHLGMD